LSEPGILCDVIDNALLHLYLTVTETSRFIPTPKRNEVLICYLKPLVKDKAYRGARKELRSLLALGKQPGCNLESKLVELHNLSFRYDKNASDARRLLDVLSQIEDKLGLPSRFLNHFNGEQPLSNIIYMLQEHIENGFIDSGEQVAPVSLFLQSSNVGRVLEFINTGGLFLAELQQMNEVKKQGHIVLHPTTRAE
jgi:hypothetical protein